MDVQVISSLINLAGGALGLALVQGVTKWLKGHYSAVQRATNKYESERRYSNRLYEHILVLRQKLIRADVTGLPDIPERDDKRT